MRALSGVAVDTELNEAAARNLTSGIVGPDVDKELEEIESSRAYAQTPRAHIYICLGPVTDPVGLCVRPTNAR